MSAGVAFRWSETRSEILRRMWEDDYTASEIALAIGGVSRNAVIGRAHRMELAGRPSPIRRRDGQYRRRGAREIPMTTLYRYARHSPPAVSSPPMPDEIAVTAPPVRLSAATVSLPVSPTGDPGEQEGGGRPCQWIAGEPSADDACKCGRPVVPNRPYCGFHCSIAFYKPAPPANAASDPGGLERLAASE